jgi:putative acetyltransferase
MKIIQDDLTNLQTLALLEIHFAGMKTYSPPGTCHFLDIAGLKKSDVTFWSVWDDESIAGCGALQAHGDQFGEVKSMRTHPNYLRRGVANLLLEQIIASAKARGYGHVSLETGSGEAFAPAIRLYETRGFVPCPPFGKYTATEFNRFYTLKLLPP